MKPLGYRSVTVLDGFWKQTREKNARISLMNVYRRFEETGRFSVLDCVKRDPPPHIFFDSDVAKWLEAAAYLYHDYPDGEIKNIIDKSVNAIAAAQLPNGYYNSYYQVYKKDKIFAERMEHELYCAGHLIEAAVALFEAGLGDKLLLVMRKYADYIHERFYVARDPLFTTCGHPEIELALVRLFECTNERKYLTLAEFFLNERGKKPEYVYPFFDSTYDQSHMPVREQTEAVGHAVRALYLYIAMAEAGRISKDSPLLKAAERLFDNIVNQKMYVTGGTGSNYFGERFTAPYDLPNEYAYAETCSAIALAFFCESLAKAGNKAKYHDVFERVLYNNLLAGQSADGKGFFYTNPLETNMSHLKFAREVKGYPYQPIVERVEVFDCSCCPPNFIRFVGRIGDCIYGEENDRAYIHQYISSEANIGKLKIKMNSGFPYDGEVKIVAEGTGALGTRVPPWCDKLTCTVNGESVTPETSDGYLLFEVKGMCEILLNFNMRPRFIYSNENVSQNCGRKAVEYGPLVLCAEGVDNGNNLRNIVIPSTEHAKVCRDGIFSITIPAERLHTSDALYSYRPPEKEKIELKLIPYFLWANRGETDMQIWFM